VALDLQPTSAAAPADGVAVASVGLSPEAAARRRERLAWAVLWSGFALFVLMVVGLVVGVRWYRDWALSARQGELEILEGTVLYQTEEAVRESVALPRQELREGDRIRTDGNGKAIISLPDGSNLQLWPNTAVQVKQLRSSTYTDGRTIYELVQSAGHTRVEVALPSTQERRFELQTPHARALLREGSYRVEAGPAGTELAARAGSATVSGRDAAVEVVRRERTLVPPGGNPSRPDNAERNLIVNGDFRQEFEGWRLGSRDEEDGVLGRVDLVPAEGRVAVRLRRQGSVRHGEAFIQQTINRDVTDEASLKLQLDARVASQSLSGGGILGWEYPVLVRLKYRDIYGSENEVVRGLYVRNPDGHPTTNGREIPANQWWPVVIDLFDDKQVPSKPAYVMWVEVEGGGWEFESFVTGIQLLAE
jgi:hypothetical protein